MTKHLLFALLILPLSLALVGCTEKKPSIASTNSNPNLAPSTGSAGVAPSAIQ
jgi:hypothetical protein